MLYKINGQYVSREKLLQLKKNSQDPASKAQSRKSEREDELRAVQKALVKELLIEILNEDELLQVQREDGIQKTSTEDTGVRKDSKESEVPVLLHEEQSTPEGVSEATTELQSE